METLIQIFAPMMGFLYHCFDRIVINGYISMLSRPENVVYFFSKHPRSPMYYKGNTRVAYERLQQMGRFLCTKPWDSSGVGAKRRPKGGLYTPDSQDTHEKESILLVLPPGHLYTSPESEHLNRHQGILLSRHNMSHHLG
jgi:hypothetical protein